MDKNIYKKANKLKEDIKTTKVFIDGVAKLFSDDPQVLYSTNIFWSYVMQNLPTGLKQKLHLAAIKYHNELQQQFDEL